MVGIIDPNVDDIKRLISDLNVPDFPPGGVPTKVAAKVFGKSEIFVRTGIEEGWLPIGVVQRNGERSNVYISPKKLWEFTGYKYEG